MQRNQSILCSFLFIGLNPFENQIWSNTSVNATSQLYVNSSSEVWTHLKNKMWSNTSENSTKQSNINFGQCIFKQSIPHEMWNRVPATEEALMSSTSCFTVHYRYIEPISITGTWSKKSPSHLKHIQCVWICILRNSNFGKPEEKKLILFVQGDVF